MNETTQKGSKRSWRLRVLSIVGGVAVVIVAGLVIFNLSASKANGADGQEAQSSDSGTEADGSGGGEDGTEGEGNGKAPVPVEVTEVTAGSVSSYISSSANLVAEFEVKILSEVEGRVAQWYVDEGRSVGKGAVLAHLVRDDAEIALRKAELKETNARMAYERGKDLADKDLISREEFDKFTMDFEIARQEKAEAEWRLEKTTIRAPFGGRISERMIQVGQNIRPGDELFQITDPEPLIARIFLPERDILGLEEGREVRIVLNAAEDTTFGGHIRQISPVVDTATGTVKVTIEAESPPESVRPGSFVTVNIVRETRPDAAVIPREAVLRELQSAHVFVVDGELAEKRSVSLGLEEGSLVEAVSGLKLGEKVIIAGQGGLRDGAKVKILGSESVASDEAGGDEIVESDAEEQTAE
jgi:membrane fusion protein (multidrug efflux system)